MLTIGDFARHGRVSIRMLRHYDAIGLLRPAHVDQSSGYRFYKAEQLSRLNRIVALKDLGFTLQQVQTILDEDVSTEELRGMLRLRRAELEAALAETASDLAQVEARLLCSTMSPPPASRSAIVVKKAISDALIVCQVLEVPGWSPPGLSPSTTCLASLRPTPGFSSR
jgi:DNA-binding transcriptional MerR regulator